MLTYGRHARRPYSKSTIVDSPKEAASASLGASVAVDFRTLQPAIAAV